jgi:hypothetical protein
VGPEVTARLDLCCTDGRVTEDAVTAASLLTAVAVLVVAIAILPPSVVFPAVFLAAALSISLGEGALCPCFEECD